MGLLATMSALVVGLLITTAKTAYDTQGGEFRRMSAEIVLLDRLLTHYGPEAKGAREHLRRAVSEILQRMESKPGLEATAPDPTGRNEGSTKKSRRSRRRATPSAGSGPRHSDWRWTSA